MYTLSEGSLDVIMNGGDYDKPILQLLANKKIQGSEGIEKYRLLLSDGKHSHSLVMLASHLNDKIITGELCDNAVVQINRFVTKLLNIVGKGERRIMVILDVTVLAPGAEVGKKLGNPHDWTAESAAGTPAPAPMGASASSTPITLPSTGSGLNNSLISKQMTHSITSPSYQAGESAEADIDDWLTFDEAEAGLLVAGEKGLYFSLLGYVISTNDNVVFKACPFDQCNEVKLVDQENGLYRCEECNKEYPNFKYCLLLVASVADPTGNQRVIAYNEAAEFMLGHTAAEIGRMFEHDKKSYAKVIKNAKYKSYEFKLYSKIESSTDETTFTTTVLNVEAIDYKATSARLIESIKSCGVDF
ncbi:replication protein A 70 kDa DNA-binding subunit-like [Epargyreus clarus]|uniref:replication protein A 70 kDa DNA-binding subunit-like n=1 Tax=Epargyreus clarus TaxID=520877 RepID=UPI003C2E37BE